MVAHGNTLLAAADYSIGDLITPPALWGQVYVYQLTDGVWKPCGPLPRPASKTLRFAHSVDFDGKRAVVGSLSDTALSRFGGTAHVYRRTIDGWSLEQTVEDTTLHTFGWAVAIDGETLAITALNKGASCVVVYHFHGGKWALQQRIGSPHADAKDFGLAIALRGDTLAIGARGEDAGGATSAGAVYVFTRKGGVWSRAARLTAPTPLENDWLGHSISLHDDRLIAGAPQCNNAKGSGKAIVFRNGPGGWAVESELVAPDAAARDWFGTSVSLESDTVAVGAYGDDGPNGPTGQGSGSCYLYRRSGGAWQFAHKYTAANPGDHPSFGDRVALTPEWLFAASVDTPVVTGPPSPSKNVRSARIFAELIEKTAEPDRIK
jgi:hypothetical protein